MCHSESEKISPRQQVKPVCDEERRSQATSNRRPLLRLEEAFSYKTTDPMSSLVWRIASLFILLGCCSCFSFGFQGIERTCAFSQPQGRILRRPELCATSDDETPPIFVSNSQISESEYSSSPQFGQVVSPLYLQNATESDDQVVVKDLLLETPKKVSKNVVVAVASITFAVLQYAWQFMHPLEPLVLLAEMQERSQPLSVIGKNSKPTVVDFWAPWCVNCKVIAPTLYQIEEDYKGKVNFCMVNGDQRAAWPAIEAFGVDAIPHLALVEADGTVDTALIGPIPSNILRADLDKLIENASGRAEGKTPQTLPYTMLDVFQGRPDQRKVSFD